MPDFFATYFGKLRYETPEEYTGRQKPASLIRCDGHVVRGLLESAYQIDCLTHACLQYYLDRFNRLQPSHLTAKRYEFDFSWAKSKSAAGKTFRGAQDYVLRP
jgi:hypothetical protein